jgi:hypothetical protein
MKYNPNVYRWMGKENIAYNCSVILFIHLKKEGNPVVSYNIDEVLRTLCQVK